MTCSRNRVSASLLGAALAALTLTAAAQGAATGAPQSILPAAPVETAPPPAGSGGDATVTTTSLDHGGQFRIGLIDDSNGGFADTLWRGTTPATATTLLPNLPIAVNSPASHDLARRLLLSSALVDPASEQGISDADRVLIAARLQALADRGDLDGLTGLAAHIGRALDDDRLVELKVEAFLLAEDYKDACVTAGEMVGGQPSADWLKLLAFCRALTGDRAGAALTVDLLQEQQTDAPLYYQLLSARLAEGPAAPPALQSLQPATPLVLAMALDLGVALPDDVTEGASPLMLAKLSRVPSLAIAKRLRAAWTVARLGGLSSAKVKEIYAAAPFTAEERSGAALVAATLDDKAAADALLYQGIVTAPAGGERARMIQAASMRARQDGGLAMLAALSADAAAEITPSADTLPAAVDIARLLLLAGRPAAAAPWYAAVRAAANMGDSGATTALIDLWPLMIVGAGGDDAPWSPEILDLWWQGQEALGAAARQQEAVTLYTLLEALGFAVPETAWSQVSGAPAASGGAAPSLGVWRGLTAAAAGGRVGETVLDALIACGDGGPGATTPVVLASVVRALKDVGLEADARRLAVEALVAHGL